MGGPEATLAPLMLGIPLLESNNSTYHLMDVNEFGWKVVEGHLQIDWDDPSNTEQVKESERASFITGV